MKRFFLLLVTLWIGMPVFAQVDAVQKADKPTAPRIFLNDREIFGPVDSLNPKEIERVEVDKELGAVKIYTAGRIKKVVTLDRYLRKRFKNYQRGSSKEVFVNGTLVNDPSHSIIWPEVIKSAAISFDRKGGSTAYRIETFEADRKSAQGGIRIRGLAEYGR
ncbi:hypothetical protein [Parapedobacter defluvii]|nr:hypothetical protein [Parapedobacter defluvii]